jgi:N-acetyl-anhydromuramyl-L-alanine amidase AmpD
MTPELIAAWDKVIPSLKTLPNPPRRIILHWNGGANRANDLDRNHYHYIVEHDGRLVTGIHNVAANMRQLRAADKYAAHTGGMNSFSIGLSFAGMLNWVPGGTTRFPLTKVQIETGMQFVALLCKRYHLSPSNSAHVFTHTEAWTIHGVKGTVNHQKTDVSHLPHLPALKPQEVGPYLRTLAQSAFSALPT